MPPDPEIYREVRARGCGAGVHTPLPGSEDHQKLYKAGVYLDPDLNKYDLEHATTPHATMSNAELEKVYQDAWWAYYSPSHMETVMRRAAATGISPGKILFLLLWYYGCFALEKYVADLVWKHVRLGAALWRFGRFRRRLKADPGASKYTDLALTDVVGEEFDALELFSSTASAKAALVKIGR